MYKQSYDPYADACKNTIKVFTCPKLIEKPCYTRQSPINIDTTNVRPERPAPMEWSLGYSTIPQSLSLLNTRDILQLKIEETDPMEVTSRLLYCPYKLQKIYFHIGTTNNKGSEHQIDNKSFAIEMQVVHSQNLKCYTDRNLIVSQFFTVQNQHHHGLQYVLDVIKEASKNGNEPIKMEPIALKEIVYTAPCSYYTYEGSLTLPPYSEDVIWNVCDTPMPISSRQMALFRTILKKNKLLRNNFRELQYRNNRKVRYVRKSFIDDFY